MVKHDIKLTREVTTRRVSNINQLGEVTWRMREGTILVCPMAAQDVRSDDIIHSEWEVQLIRNYVTLKTRVMDKSQ